MNLNKIKTMLGMKNIERMADSPRHRSYNLLEHCYIVAMLFRWFASEEDVAYDMVVFDKILLHDYIESITGDLNYTVKHYSKETNECWDEIECEIVKNNPHVAPYTGEQIRAALSERQFRLFKMCDYLCLWIFCQQEMALGNSSKKIIECNETVKSLFLKYSLNWLEFKSIKKFLETYEA